MTLTLQWEENYDFDLHLTCEHGKLCYYRNMDPCSECKVNLDVDMRSHNDRKDGSRFMIENIKIEKPLSGHKYQGLVDNYGGNHRRPGYFDIKLTTTNELGKEVVIKKWTAARDESSDCPRTWPFWFIWDENYRKVKCSD